MLVSKMVRSAVSDVYTLSMPPFFFLSLTFTLITRFVGIRLWECHIQRDKYSGIRL